MSFASQRLPVSPSSGRNFDLDSYDEVTSQHSHGLRAHHVLGQISCCVRMPVCSGWFDMAGAAAESDCCFIIGGWRRGALSVLGPLNCSAVQYEFTHIHAIDRHHQGNRMQAQAPRFPRPSCKQPLTSITLQATKAQRSQP